jgi:hypothetical protein
MANNIGQSFIDGACQTSALLGRKTDFLGQAHHRAAHYAQDFGIAGQLKPEKPTCALQFEVLPSRMYTANRASRN